MSDEQYDRLNDIHEALTGDIVAGSKGTTKTAHEYADLMGTLKKCTNMAELEAWLEDLVEDRNDVAIAFSNKMDGNSILIEYEPDGSVALGVTRGKEGHGVDVTNTFRARPLPYEFASRVAIKYEALVSKSNMDAVSELRGKELADPRGAITGILHREDGDRYLQYIDLAPIDMAFKTGDVSREEALAFFEDLDVPGIYPGAMGFTVVEGTLDYVVEQIGNAYALNSSTRADWDYMVDGMVIEFVREADRERLGWHHGSSHYPKYAIALKYPHMEKNTEAIRMEFDIGPSGRITPCVIFRPVVINGRTYQRTSIANYKRFQELNIGEGTKLLFQLRNDVLGWLDVLDVPENVGILPFEHIETCPSCGSDLWINEKETFAYCNNDDCDARKVGKVIQWVKKLGLKGIGESTLVLLSEAGLLNEPRDLYHIDRKKAAQIPGLGDSSVKGIVETVAAKLDPKDFEVLAAASPEGIGRTILKPVLKRIRFRDGYEMAKTEAGMASLFTTLLGIDGVEKVNAEKIIHGFQHPITKWAIESGDLSVVETYEDPATKATKGATAMGVAFCVTGKLDFGTRDEFVAAAEAKGNTFTSSVTAKTDVLVNNDTLSSSGKNQKAKQLGKPIMSEREFIQKYMK